MDGIYRLASRYGIDSIPYRSLISNRRNYGKFGFFTSAMAVDVLSMGNRGFCNIR